MYLLSRNQTLPNIFENTNVSKDRMSESISPLIEVRKMDEKLFEESFQNHFDGMFRYCHTMVNDQEEAEDIVQSVFADLWQDRHKIEFHTSIQAYLYKGVYFKCMNRIKRQKVNKRFTSRYTYQSSNLIDEGNPAIFEDVNQKVNEAIAALPDQCRKIFTLSRSNGMKYQEIADHLQLSIKTIENQMGRALKSLRDNLADYLHLIIINLISFF